MYKCVFALAVLGSSTCYHHHGQGHGYPSHPQYPSHAPSQSDWNFPSHSFHPHGVSHAGYWDFHGGYNSWHNPSGHPTGYNSQWPYKPSQNNQPHAGLQGQTTGVDHHQGNTPAPEQIGQNGNSHGTIDSPFFKPFEFTAQQASAADRHQSNTPSPEKPGQDEDMSSQSADYVKKPFQINGQGVGHQSPSVPGKFSQTGGSVDKPIEVNDQDPITDSHQSTTTYAQEITGEIENVTSQIVNPVDTPVLFGFQDTAALNDGNTDSNPGEIVLSISNITETENSPSKPLEKNQTSESNTTEFQAYITGPDNTLELDQVITTIFGLMAKPVPAVELELNFKAPVPSLQWHVGIYTKMETPYSQICGGTLVKTDVVITAAHCFWSDDEGLLQPALFAAAAGKLQRAWDSSADAYAQKSDIREIQTPPRFRGAKTSFQDDIAVARLSAPLELAPGVRPACVDFDLALDRQHLTPGNKGTVVGSGLTMLNGPPSETLNFLELPYVDIDQCIRRVPQTFLKYITSDKICAGDWMTGRALCLGDSGGGLIYSTDDVPYLRGVASTAPRDHNQCNAHTVATFTHLASHMTFLTEQVPDITENCRTLYEGTLNDTSDVKSNGNTLALVQSNLKSEISERDNSNAESGERKLNVASQSGLVILNVADQSGQVKPNVADQSGQVKPNVADQSDQPKPNVIVNVTSEERKSDMGPLPLITGSAAQENFECNCSCKKKDE